MVQQIISPYILLLVSLDARYSEFEELLLNDL